MNPTDIAVLIAVGCLLGWEAWTLANRRAGDTISESVWRARRRPLIPFLGGMLASHFFWQAQDCLEALK